MTHTDPEVAGSASTVQWVEEEERHTATKKAATDRQATPWDVEATALKQVTYKCKYPKSNFAKINDRVASAAERRFSMPKWKPKGTRSKQKEAKRGAQTS